MIQNDRKKFSWQARRKSFVYAWQGFKALLSTEHNTRIHLVLTITVIGAALVLRVSRIELIILVMVMATVWVAEIFNTALEKAMDFMSTEHHPQIKLVKDLAAAAVLITAIAAIIVGCLIFIPKMLQYIGF
jgi:diacylglycerol kinase